MNLRIKTTEIFLLAVALGVVFPSDALAYLDPGTGSLVIQSVIAAAAAAAYAVRLYWGRIRLAFRPNAKIDASDSGGPPVGSA